MSTRSTTYIIEVDENDVISYVDEDPLNSIDDQPPKVHQFRCDICDSSFDTKEERNLHIEDHFKCYECPNCTRSFVGDRAFEYHTRSGKCKTVVKQTHFRCNLCNGKVFNSESALKVHEKDDHGCAIDADRITCEQCHRTFAQLRYLRKHIHEVHHKLTQFNCSVCHKVFNRRSNLNEHMLIHENLYLAPCSICEKKFRTKSALRLHERMHTGEKPYKCDLCLEKAYAYNTDLKRHKRQAHGVFGTPHPCHICHQVFYEPKLLRKHHSKYHRSENEADVVVD